MGEKSQRLRDLNTCGVKTVLLGVSLASKHSLLEEGRFKRPLLMLYKRLSWADSGKEVTGVVVQLSKCPEPLKAALHTATIINKYKNSGLPS